MDTVTIKMLNEDCKKSNALDFIKDTYIMPDWYNIIVGEKRIKLSGGKKQRVVIARALIRKPKILF